MYVLHNQKWMHVDYDSNVSGPHFKFCLGGKYEIKSIMNHANFLSLFKLFRCQLCLLISWNEVFFCTNQVIVTHISSSKTSVSNICLNCWAFCSLKVNSQQFENWTLQANMSNPTGWFIYLSSVIFVFWHVEMRCFFWIFQMNLAHINSNEIIFEVRRKTKAYFRFQFL